MIYCSKCGSYFWIKIGEYEDGEVWKCDVCGQLYLYRFQPEPFH